MPELQVILEERTPSGASSKSSRRAENRLCKTQPIKIGDFSFFNECVAPVCTSEQA